MSSKGAAPLRKGAYPSLRLSRITKSISLSEGAEEHVNVDCATSGEETPCVAAESYVDDCNDTDSLPDLNCTPLPWQKPNVDNDTESDDTVVVIADDVVTLTSADQSTCSLYDSQLVSDSAATPAVEDPTACCDDITAHPGTLCDVSRDSTGSSDGASATDHAPGVVLCPRDGDDARDNFSEQGAQGSGCGVLEEVPSHSDGCCRDDSTSPPMTAHDSDGMTARVDSHNRDILPSVDVNDRRLPGDVLGSSTNSGGYETVSTPLNVVDFAVSSQSRGDDTDSGDQTATLPQHTEHSDSAELGEGVPTLVMARSASRGSIPEADVISLCSDENAVSSIDEKKKDVCGQVAMLENLLKDIRDKIEKLEEAELSLDDLSSEDNAYIQMDRYKARFVEVWNKLCEVKGRPRTTGRPTERKFVYKGTKWRKINRKVEKLINKFKAFPDYQDIWNIVRICNKKHYHGSLSHNKMEVLSKLIFTEVGNMLQERRHEDFVTNFGCSFIDKFLSSPDPALTDKRLRQKLEENKNKGRTKMEAVLKKFVKKQDGSSGHNSREKETETERDDTFTGGETDRESTQRDIERARKRQSDSGRREAIECIEPENNALQQLYDDVVPDYDDIEADLRLGRDYLRRGNDSLASLNEDIEVESDDTLPEFIPIHPKRGTLSPKDGEIIAPKDGEIPSGNSSFLSKDEKVLPRNGDISPKPDFSSKHEDILTEHGNLRTDWDSRRPKCDEAPPQYGYMPPEYDDTTTECGDTPAKCDNTTPEHFDMAAECGDTTREYDDMPSECDAMATKYDEISLEYDVAPSECDNMLPEKDCMSAENDTAQTSNDELKPSVDGNINQVNDNSHPKHEMTEQISDEFSVGPGAELEQNDTDANSKGSAESNSSALLEYESNFEFANGVDFEPEIILGSDLEPESNMASIQQRSDFGGMEPTLKTREESVIWGERTRKCFTTEIKTKTKALGEESQRGLLQYPPARKSHPIGSKASEGKDVESNSTQCLAIPEADLDTAGGRERSREETRRACVNAKRAESRKPSRRVHITTLKVKHFNANMPSPVDQHKNSSPQPVPMSLDVLDDGAAVENTNSDDSFRNQRINHGDQHGDAFNIVGTERTVETKQQSIVTEAEQSAKGNECQIERSPESKRSAGGSKRSAEGSKHCAKGSKHSVEESKQSAKGSKHSIEDSKYSAKGSKHSVEESKYSAEGSKHSSEDSKNSAGGSKHSVEESKHSTEESKYSAKGSKHSVEESKHSTEESKHSAKGSKHSVEESKHSAEGSKHSAEESETSAGGSNYSAEGNNQPALESKDPAKHTMPRRVKLMTLDTDLKSADCRSGISESDGCKTECKKRHRGCAVDNELYQKHPEQAIYRRSPVPYERSRVHPKSPEQNRAPPCSLSEAARIQMHQRSIYEVGQREIVDNTSSSEAERKNPHQRSQCKQIEFGSNNTHLKSHAQMIIPPQVRRKHPEEIKQTGELPTMSQRDRKTSTDSGLRVTKKLTQEIELETHSEYNKGSKCFVKLPSKPNKSELKLAESFSVHSPDSENGDGQNRDVSMTSDVASGMSDSENGKSTSVEGAPCRVNSQASVLPTAVPPDQSSSGIPESLKSSAVDAGKTIQIIPHHGDTTADDVFCSTKSEDLAPSERRDLTSLIQDKPALVSSLITALAKMDASGELSAILRDYLNNAIDSGSVQETDGPNRLKDSTVASHADGGPLKRCHRQENISCSNTDEPPEKLSKTVEQTKLSPAQNDVRRCKKYQSRYSCKEKKHNHDQLIKTGRGDSENQQKLFTKGTRIEGRMKNEAGPFCIDVESDVSDVGYEVSLENTNPTRIKNAQKRSGALEENEIVTPSGTGECQRGVSLTILYQENDEVLLRNDNSGNEMRSPTRPFRKLSYASPNRYRKSSQVEQLDWIEFIAKNRRSETCISRRESESGGSESDDLPRTQPTAPESSFSVNTSQARVRNNNESVAVWCRGGEEIEVPDKSMISDRRYEQRPGALSYSISDSSSVQRTHKAGSDPSLPPRQEDVTPIDFALPTRELPQAVSSETSPQFKGHRRGKDPCENTVSWPRGDDVFDRLTTSPVKWAPSGGNERSETAGGGRSLFGPYTAVDFGEHELSEDWFRDIRSPEDLFGSQHDGSQAEIAIDQPHTQDVFEDPSCLDTYQDEPRSGLCQEQSTCKAYPEVLKIDPVICDASFENLSDTMAVSSPNKSSTPVICRKRKAVSTVDAAGAQWIQECPRCRFATGNKLLERKHPKHESASEYSTGDIQTNCLVQTQLTECAEIEVKERRIAHRRNARYAQCVEWDKGTAIKDGNQKWSGRKEDGGTHSGDRGTHSGDRGTHSGDRGTHSGDRGTHSGDRGTRSGDRGTHSSNGSSSIDGCQSSSNFFSPLRSEAVKYAESVVPKHVKINERARSLVTEAVRRFSATGHLGCHGDAEDKTWSDEGCEDQNNNVHGLNVASPLEFDEAECGKIVVPTVADATDGHKADLDISQKALEISDNDDDSPMSSVSKMSPPMLQQASSATDESQRTPTGCKSSGGNLRKEGVSPVSSGKSTPESVFIRDDVMTCSETKPTFVIENVVGNVLAENEDNTHVIVTTCEEICSPLRHSDVCVDVDLASLDTGDENPRAQEVTDEASQGAEKSEDLFTLVTNDSSSAEQSQNRLGVNLSPAQLENFANSFGSLNEMIQGVCAKVHGQQQDKGKSLRGNIIKGLRASTHGKTKRTPAPNTSRQKKGLRESDSRSNMNTPVWGPIKLVKPKIRASRGRKKKTQQPAKFVPHSVAEGIYPGTSPGVSSAMPVGNLAQFLIPFPALGKGVNTVTPVPQMSAPFTGQSQNESYFSDVAANPLMQVRSFSSPPHSNLPDVLQAYVPSSAYPYGPPASSMFWSPFGAATPHCITPDFNVMAAPPEPPTRGRQCQQITAQSLEIISDEDIPATQQTHQLPTSDGCIVLDE